LLGPDGGTVPFGSTFRIMGPNLLASLVDPILDPSPISMWHGKTCLESFSIVGFTYTSPMFSMGRAGSVAVRLCKRLVYSGLADDEVDRDTMMKKNRIGLRFLPDFAGFAIRNRSRAERICNGGGREKILNIVGIDEGLVGVYIEKMRQRRERRG